ncbi:hypothetical protein [Streptomyces sp. NPDC098781]|uniref:hypothetical protein n=1 Tax=Streptomyces sp. NPDC098781 TaxID=3366097 RepID=UPI0038036FBA
MRTRVPDVCARSSSASISARHGAISAGRTTSPSSTWTRTDSGAMACSPSPSTTSAEVCSGPIEMADHEVVGAATARYVRLRTPVANRRRSLNQAS